MSCALTCIYVDFCSAADAIENILEIAKNVADIQRTQIRAQYIFYLITLCFNILSKVVILIGKT